MKKITKKFMTLFVRGILISIIIVAVILLINVNMKRMRGNISVNVGGTVYELSSVECRYVGGGDDEELTYYSTSSGLAFKNTGFRTGMYEYTFPIQTENLNISPRIFIFKSNRYDVYNLDIDIRIYEEGDNGTWNAYVYVDMNGINYQQMLENIEYNGLKFQIGP